MLPLALLNASKAQSMMVELKNGETYNGYLHACDNLMNLVLRDVILTAPDGEHFWKQDECFIRGSIVCHIHSPQIKYVRIPEVVLDNARDLELEQREQRNKAHQRERQAERQGERRQPDSRGRGRGGPRGRGAPRGRGHGAPRTSAPRGRPERPV